MNKLILVLGGAKKQAPKKCQVIYGPSLSVSILKKTTHRRMSS